MLKLLTSTVPHHISSWWLKLILWRILLTQRVFTCTKYKNAQYETTCTCPLEICPKLLSEPGREVRGPFRNCGPAWPWTGKPGISRILSCTYPTPKFMSGHDKHQKILSWCSIRLEKIFFFGSQIFHQSRKATYASFSRSNSGDRNWLFLLRFVTEVISVHNTHYQAL